MPPEPSTTSMMNAPPSRWRAFVEVPTSAWLLRGFVLLMLATVLGWAAFWLARGEVLVALLGALLIALLHVPVLAVELLLVMLSSRQAEPALRPRLRDACAAGTAEAWVLLRPFLLDLPMWWPAVPDAVPAAAPGTEPRRGIVLVHGFLNNRGMWNGWLRRLRAIGVPCIAVDLEPPLQDIDVQAVAIGLAVERLHEATGLSPVVVGHSMGGVAARAWWRHRPVEALHALVTIGSPHDGSRAAGWVHALLPAASLAQMRPGSRWLRALAQAESPARRARMLCIAGACDNVVLPGSSALLPGARHLVMPACAHTELLQRDAVWREVLRLCAADDR